MRMEFSSTPMEDRKKWHNTFQMLKEKNSEPQILYPAEISFRNEKKIKTLLNERKLRICHHQAYTKRMAKGKFS